MTTFSLLSGVLVVDKPKGMTSTDVVEAIKKCLNAKKVGHGGTLDPLATGVLPILLNQATKIAQIFLEGDKLYKGVFILGLDTDTYDLTGKILKRVDASNITKEDIEKIIPSFIGELSQAPPPYSAAKYKGRPLYKYARDGLLITKKPKTIRVYDFKILEKNNSEVSFLLACSKGTYVRGIVHELGQVLKCGAILKDLTRLKKSIFTLDQALPLDEICRLSREDPTKFIQIVIPIEKALEFLPKVIVNEEMAKKIRAGQRIATSTFFSWVKFQKLSINTSDRWIRFLTPQKELVAIIENPFYHPSSPYLVYFKIFPSTKPS